MGKLNLFGAEPVITFLRHNVLLDIEGKLAAPGAGGKGKKRKLQPAPDAPLVFGPQPNKPDDSDDEEDNGNDGVDRRGGIMEVEMELAPPGEESPAMLARLPPEVTRKATLTGLKK